jgi:hypothetical protein
MDSFYVIHHTILEKCIGFILMALMISLWGTLLYFYNNEVNFYKRKLRFIFINIFIFIAGSIIFILSCIYIFDRFIMDKYVFIKP